MMIHDCVVFVKTPPGDTAVKRAQIPLGQCGTILKVHKEGNSPELYKVTFGDGFGTVWLGEESLELMNDEPGPIPLSESPLAAAVGRDLHNESVLMARGSADALRLLAMLAIDIALGCPLERKSQPGYYTYVSRDTVREIRSVLEAAGIPWKQQHKELHK